MISSLAFFGWLILATISSATSVEKKMNSLQKQLDEVTSRLLVLESARLNLENMREGDGKSMKAQAQVSAGGAVYTRWGRSVCGADSSLMYEGYAANSATSVSGGGTNYQCLPFFSESDSISVNGFVGSLMAAAEYKTGNFGLFPSALNQNVPCARCYTGTRSAIMMIPGIVSCPLTWSTEYTGYLMTQRDSRNHQATYECVDGSPEFVPNGSGNDQGSGFFFVRPNCNAGISCLPYNAGEELQCVVCSK